MVGQRLRRMEIVKPKTVWLTYERGEKSGNEKVPWLFDIPIKVDFPPNRTHNSERLPSQTIATILNFCSCLYILKNARVSGKTP
jgi:hypothetical protein